MEWRISIYLYHHSSAWSSSTKASKLNQNKQLCEFAADHALNNNLLMDIKCLRRQYKDTLCASGLLRFNESDNKYGNDPLLTSCCLVAGLYPNVASLVRPSKELKINRAFLITKFGENSFQVLIPFNWPAFGKRVKVKKMHMLYFTVNI